MDWLQFFSSIVSSLAWPAVVVSGIALLRKPLGELVPGLRRAKYKDLELEFERGVRELEEQKATLELAPTAATALPSPATSIATTIEPSPETSAMPADATTLLDEAEQLVQLFPTASVLVAWSAVETRLRSAAQALDLIPKVGSYSLTRVIRQLSERQALSREAVSVLDRMRNLRNIAAHEPGTVRISSNDALEYVALARWVVEAIGDSAH